MATPLAELGQNTEIDENSNGETVIRNTQTGTEVRLADFVDVVGPLGDSSNPVAGTSHFESLNTDRASIGETSTRIFSTDQTIPDQSVEQVNFDSIADDNLDAADTDNDRITIPRDGQYDIQFYGRASVDGSDNTNRSRCGILRNGNLIRETSNVLSGDFVRSEVQAVILGVELSAGDHIAVEVKNFSIGDSYSFDGSGDERGPILEVSKSG